MARTSSRKRSAAAAGLPRKADRGDEAELATEEVSADASSSEDEAVVLKKARQGKEQAGEEERSSSDDDSSDDETEDAAKKLAVGLADATQGKMRKVILVMDEATLEPVKTSRGSFELLNCDDHLGLHKKLNKDPSHSRPDIAHQMLLAALDSPLNKAGHLEIFIRTNKNVLIKVSEHLRIPRTFKRFSGLMIQLLHKMKIRAVDGNKTLLKVVKNPITRHLPPNARIFASEVDGTLVDAHEFVPALPDNTPVVFVLGAIAHGNINVNYAEAVLSFSEYPLSGACTVSRICGAFERKWGII
mmetsp:Transcript_23473/g.66750  ORF Transcript_23473/g.66750 Transcript_23473/m.66750 type:complete len:301 (+) Transcript_23473:71-973(+)